MHGLLLKSFFTHTLHFFSLLPFIQPAKSVTLDRIVIDTSADKQETFIGDVDR